MCYVICALYNYHWLGNENNPNRRWHRTEMDTMYHTRGYRLHWWLIALLSHTEDHMQEKTRKFEENARVVGLKINAKKTKVMYLSIERLPVIFVQGKQLDTVDSFNYLGSCTKRLELKEI